MFEKEICIKCGAINTKNFEFDRWAIKNTVQKFLYLYIYTGLDCCVHHYVFIIKPSLVDNLLVEKEEVPLSHAARGLFCNRRGKQAGLAVIPTCAKNKQHSFQATFLKKTNKQKYTPSCHLVSDQEGKKKEVTTQFKFWLQEEVSILKHLSYVLLIYISVYVWPS